MVPPDAASRRLAPRAPGQCRLRSSRHPHHGPHHRPTPAAHRPGRRLRGPGWPASRLSRHPMVQCPITPTLAAPGRLTRVCHVRHNFFLCSYLRPAPRRLSKASRRPGCQLIYSVSWEQGGQACSDLDCGHGRCWIEEAHVTELTSLPPEGPGGDRLDGWPKTMRVFAGSSRTRRPAHLVRDRRRLAVLLWVTNGPQAPRVAGPALFDAAHRVHARVEDGRNRAAGRARLRQPAW